MQRHFVRFAFVGALLLVGFLLSTSAIGAAQGQHIIARPGSHPFDGGQQGHPINGHGDSPLDTPDTYFYDMRAYPNAFVPSAAAIAAERAKAQHIATRPDTVSWQSIGPDTVSGFTTSLQYGPNLSVGGRTTILATNGPCSAKACVLYAGTAGGGVWRSLNALSATPTWTALTDGQVSLAIGTLAVVPNAKAISTKNPYTIYVGTGEANNSGDAEAGVGMYKIVDNGATPTVTQIASQTHFLDRAISTIVVDPADKTHQTLYVATAQGRHGGTAVSGASKPAPTLPDRGIFKTTNGGTSWTQILDSENVSYPSFFYGSVNTIDLVIHNKIRTLYAGIQGVGVIRTTDDGATWSTVWSSDPAHEPASVGDRFDFAISPTNTDIMYLAVGGLVVNNTDPNGGQGYLWVTKNLTAATPIFSKLPGADGFCTGQCWYDMFVRVDPKHANIVYVGGSAKYNDPGAAISHGREVIRSNNGGLTFTDMSGDLAGNTLHPDQHALAFDPTNTHIWFEGDDGGVWRNTGKYVSGTAFCTVAVNKAACQANLASIPAAIVDMNTNLGALQLQNIAVSGVTANTILGGTQDNGTELYTGAKNWQNVVGGDGGQPAFDPSNDKIRYHNYYGSQTDVSVNGGLTTKSGNTLSQDWNWISDPFFASGEAASFYTPVVADQKVANAGVVYEGLESLWRTTDHGDPRIGTANEAAFVAQCNEFNPTSSGPCGDWKAMGGSASKLATDTTNYATDRAPAGRYVVAVAIAPTDSNVVYVGTYGGRVFKTTNALAADPTTVTWTRVDDGALANGSANGSAVSPGRFVSGIVVDPTNANIIYVSYSGYSANTPGTPGHVFKADTSLVVTSLKISPATWTNLSGNLADAPATALQIDPAQPTHFFIGTDFGVFSSTDSGTTWSALNSGLPTTAVYGLVLDPAGTTLYAATHGRGVWKYALS